MSWSVPVGSVVKVHPSSGREVPLMDDSPALPRLQLGIVAGEARLFITAARAGVRAFQRIGMQKSNVLHVHS